MIFKKLFLFFISSFFLFAISLGCRYDPIKASGSGGVDPTDKGVLYLLDKGNRQVYVYNDLKDLSGSKSPNRTISIFEETTDSNGITTKITNPTAIAIDGGNDALYVANQKNQNILVFAPASEADGEDETPTRKLAGVTEAGSMFLDSANDRLYVSDVANQTIRVWDSVSTKQDGATSNRNIPFNYNLKGFTVDPERNLLYVGEAGATKTVHVYESASTLATEPLPSRSFTNATQDFTDLTSLTMNAPNDTLFVLETGIPSVEVFDSASQATGEVESNRELKGSKTTLNSKMRQILFLNSNLYILSSTSEITIWEDVNQLTGDVAPNRTIIVTPASDLVGFAIDPTR